MIDIDIDIDNIIFALVLVITKILIIKTINPI